MSQSYINENLYGIVLISEPEELYIQISKMENVIVSQDIFEKDAFVKVKQIRECSNTLVDTLTRLTHFTLLNVFLEHLADIERIVTKSRDLRLSKVIFVEINAFLSSDCEYLLLLYVYLLKTGSELPRLYVIMLYENLEILEFLRRLFQKQEFNGLSKEDIRVEEYYNTIQNYDDLAREAGSIILISNEVEFVVIPKTTTVIQQLSDLKLGSLKVDLYCVDPTIRISTSSLYVGNRRIKKTVDVSYLVGSIRLIKRFNPQAKIIVLKLVDSSVSTVSRENLYKDFSQDVILFAKHLHSLQLLYKYYSTDNQQIQSRISMSVSLLKRLNFLNHSGHLEKSSQLITSLHIHPVIAKIIIIWYEVKQLPLFRILLFSAVIHTFERANREIKEHGLKEMESDVALTSRFGESMAKALRIIGETQRAVCPELGKTGELLERYIVQSQSYFKLDKMPIGLFNLNKFTIQLSAILKEYFSQDLLTKVEGSFTSGKTFFHKEKHSQIIWHVNSNPPYEKIFPIVSVLERNANKVLLFVPII